MKLFLIDGHALIFKMYYAFLGRPMVNSKGQDTSILFGFTKYLLEMIERERPTHLAVSFDPPGGTFRNTLYPAYKANRTETPQLVIDALEPLTRIAGALGIPVLMVPGFEADDVIGSAAKRFAREGMDVYMVTPDKDYGQLVQERIFQYKPGKGGGDAEILGPAEICAKYGIDNPLQVIDILTLCGDSADNVPGVQGVGPVSAGKLLSKYGSVEAIYENLGELTGNMRSKFEAAKDHIALSKTLVTIKTDIDLSVDAESLKISETLGPEIVGLLDFYEMPSLKRHISAKTGSQSGQNCSLWQAPPASEPAFELKKTDASLEDVLSEARGQSAISVVFADGNVCLASGRLAAKGSLKDIPGGIRKYVFNLKEAVKSGFEPDDATLDVQIVHYLLNPERSHSLESVCKEILGVELKREDSPADLFSQQETDSAEDFPLQACALFEIGRRLSRELEDNASCRELYEKIEGPLSPVLARMEKAGVLVDIGSLRDFALSLRGRIAEREKQIRELAAEPSLNVSSPKQLGSVLFEKMRLDPFAKKPAKGNWPTDEETLLTLADKSPIIDLILDFRGAKKLLSTYIEPFPSYIDPADGRVHTTFNQTLTSTGRLSSSNPNLQNIPIRTDEGREIRRAFSAPAGSVIMSADYSQIELRLMAHFCKDEHMVAAFRAGEDVHAAMASKIFSTPLQAVTPEQRRIAKTANFGIMYGISSFGLAQRLHCSRKEAAKIIEDYFAGFPLIKTFIDGTLSFAREHGYVETLFGRRRYVPDVNSSNGNLRAFAQRNAVNAPIQGSAADIIKLAMIGVDSELRRAGLKSRMVLQIHDELVLEVPENEIDRVRDILVGQMEGVVNLSVPLTVECSYGKDWLEAH